MTAGRGIIHSEMPQQVAGRMRGFQLWINLPGKEKMKPAGYRDLEPEEIPRVYLGDSQVTVIAGVFSSPGAAPVSGPVGGGATDPLYLDLALTPASALNFDIPSTHTALIYVYEGTATVGGQKIAKGTLARLGDGDAVELRTPDDHGARALVLAGKPLREPVVAYGPFVMNTTAEIEQAVRDYRSGRLTA